VSKFAGLSVFSGLNNLHDITFNSRFASICGYTQQELENYFPEHLEDVSQYTGMEKAKLLDVIRHWYNGYSWDGSTFVYTEKYIKVFKLIQNYLIYSLLFPLATLFEYHIIQYGTYRNCRASISFYYLSAELISLFLCYRCLYSDN